jgi:hypothetical protein
MKVSQTFNIGRSAVTAMIPIFTGVLEGKKASVIEAHQMLPFVILPVP